MKTFKITQEITVTQFGYVDVPEHLVEHEDDVICDKFWEFVETQNIEWIEVSRDVIGWDSRECK